MRQQEMTEKRKNMDAFIIEVKLSINHSLFEKGYITEEIYTKAKELIIKS